MFVRVCLIVGEMDWREFDEELFRHVEDVVAAAAAKKKNENL